MELPYDPAIALLDIIYYREIKAHVHTKTYTQMFITALFVVAKTENNSDIFQWVVKQIVVYP